MGDILENFSRSEFACKCGCGFDTVDIQLGEVLQDVREHFGRMVKINSGCRCERHNLHEGGSENSQHLYGRAADFEVKGVHADVVADYLEKRWPNCGIGRYVGRTHVDTRGHAARWDFR